MAISVLQAADAMCEAVRGFDPHLLTGTDAAKVAAKLAETAKACTAAGALAAARAVDAGAHTGSGAKDGPAWFARLSGTTPGQAHEALDTARSLQGLPDTQQALLSGEISMGQASEITRTEAETPGAERELLPQARHADLAKTKQDARQYRQAHTPVKDLHARQHAARYFKHWQDSLGMVCFRGALPPQTGLPFVRRIELAAHQVKTQARAAGQPDQPFPARAADALFELTTRHTAADSKSKPSRPVDLVIVCDIHAWRRGFARPGEACHIIGGGPIPVELAKELSNDAFLKAALHDGIAIHTISHFGRRYSAHLRTALDLGPVPDFGGRACSQCGQRWGLQTDHIDPVAHRGLTEYANLQPLCWTCHQTKTEQDRQAGLLGPKAKARGPGRARPPNTS